MKRIILPALLVLTTIARTQDFASLSVGDKMTDASFQLMGQKNVTRFSSIQQRLVILDFWATWCGACVANFPKLDSLQKDFNRDLKIILVNEKSNKDGLSKVQQFYNNWKIKNGSPLQLPTIVDDIELGKTFPHRGIPHYVWIYNGEVIGITAAPEVTRSTVKKILAGEPYFLARKLEVVENQPMYLTEYVPIERIPGYSILVRGDNGLSRGYQWKKDQQGAVNGIRVLNASLPDMYRFILIGLDESLAHRKRILIATKDSASLFYKASPHYSRADWEASHLYSFEFSGTAEPGKALYYNMIDAINFYSGFTGTIEKVKRNCLILTGGNTDSLRTKGGVVINGLGDPKTPVLQNLPIEWLVKRINNNDALPLVIDETNFTGNIDLHFAPEDFRNFESVTAALKRYGLVLEKKEREIDMLVIRNK